VEITTRERIISAASRLFYGVGIRAVSMDAVAKKAGLTKRTVYNHFKSKDDLVATYLQGRDQSSLSLFERWFVSSQGGLADKVRGMFLNLAQSARHPNWKGCGFLRATAELANMQAHPAIEVGAAHKKKFENWMRALFEVEGIENGLPLARQIMLLLDGSLAVTLLHDDPSYMETAGDAAYLLVKSALSPDRVDQDRKDETKSARTRRLWECRGAAAADCPCRERRTGCAVASLACADASRKPSPGPSSGPPLGSDAYARLRAALVDRLEALDAPKEIAVSMDMDGHPGMSAATA
jgi:AcrR family transcriptional regulator